MKKRYWSIRSKIIVLAAVPLTALLALWIFATVLTAGPAFNLLSARTVLDNVGNPGIELVGQLQRERLFSVEYLSATGPVSQDLLTQRSATDKALANFRSLSGSDEARGATSDALRGRIDLFLTQLASLTGNRGHIDKRDMDAIGAQNLFNNVIGGGFQTFAATASFNDERIDGELRALTTVGHGQEYLSRVDALVGGATASGSFTPETRGDLIQDVGTARFLLARGVEDMADADRTAYNLLTNGTAYQRVDGLLTQLVQQSRDGAATPVSSAEFRPAYVGLAQQLREFELQATDSLTGRSRPVAEKVLIRLGLAGIVGLAALAVSLYLSVRVGRSIVGRLRRLHGEAREMAVERLPTVVRRLQRGEDVDVGVETPPLEYGRDEIGQLGHAFNEVQRTAVQTAVEEANVRRGLNEVFLNIARRSQTLLHRQLALLDRMERRETEPQELEDLYRVDHLATRMRRHAEDLVILAGAAPGRGWRNPVPVIDVVRGAISEVEDYKRIDIRSVESASVLGRAVGDVIHLLAELLENAASFSPPHTRVHVSGQVLPNGYGIEIEDRGLGMTPEALDEANRRLVEPPDFDPSDSARLGLFVVAQLANRHGIRVSLRASAYAGVTAIVLVPGDLIVSAGATSLPPGLAGERPQIVPGTGERPLVGSGSDDPSRHSLAALQWQGSEQLQQVTASGHPIINGTARPGPETHRPVRVTGEQPLIGEPISGQRRAPAVPGGPTPSSVAAGITQEGLVQRRRVRRPVDLGSAPPPSGEMVPSSLGDALRSLNETPQLEGVRPGAIPAQRSVPRNSAPAEPAETTEDGLPRRVRQANLVPQLRRSAGEQPVEETPAQLRSPEQVRSIMSALQHGTTRGRIDASRYLEGGDELTPRNGPTATGEGKHGGKPGSTTDSVSEDRSNPHDTGIHVPGSGASFADAATVSFPAIVNLALAGGDTAQGGASSGGGQDAGGNRADGSGSEDVPRPEKDA